MSDHDAGFLVAGDSSWTLVVLLGAIWPQAASAAPGDAAEIGAGATLDPILSMRLRSESADGLAIDTEKSWLQAEIEF